MTNDVPTIRYFSLRGRAEIPRMMFEVAGEKYESIYQKGEEWPQEKARLLESCTHSQGALPVYQDAQVGTLTQSKAINRYVAKKLGFYGNNLAEEARIDEYVECVVEIWESLFMCIYSPQFEEQKDAAKDEHIKKLKNLENFLFSDKKKFSSNPEKFLVGDKLSLADFSLVFLLDITVKFCPEEMKQLKKLEAFRRQFHQIPNFKAYCASDRRPKTLNPSFAKFGGTAEETQQGDE
mmetsp:Transcript_9155/g.33798  ORF Transcript_9155/g.33798 Transcript_9155/m.33798 type:complete len:236 (-) Transcript_9155:161-868(-)|eukprot:CAMPEP_0117451520 /NCGR_PEP_ID=MMETSP0759-20121206/9054_1 /TAXON_ID=63605 /ORGANISM="Percolomonas cosmopolitus, Strain WS" /LENGTH=235 /DNA_ID=CAMNT_0005244131 /DNA_START=47 /DNA_END=754 /DNA_ORIENTATION=-